MNYQVCNCCKTYHDDGGLYKGKFVCHDCLDKIFDKRENKKAGDLR